jgi:hypothetical protein
LSNRLTTVYDHPAFVPHAIPVPGKLRFPDGSLAPGLGEVLFMPLDELTRLPTGYLNLLCATALPDTADLDIPACMRTLHEWTDLVHRETDRSMYRFHRNPSDFENSEAYYRMLVLITVLQRDLAVRYDPDCIKSPIFKSSREGFIHGLLTGNKTGTCANMPVLYAAVGRRLGYPIYLVTAKGHIFCRWHNARTGERFNVEASGHGLGTPTDDHYTEWPRPITKEEVHHGIYLRNLDSAEELALFMATRGHCLRDKGHMLDSIVAYSHAHRLAPTDPVCMAFLLGALNREIDLRTKKELPCSYRQAEIFKRKDCPPLAQYTIDPRYMDRAAGVNIDTSKPGRLAPNQ